jgi:hypothetical protein
MSGEASLYSNGRGQQRAAVSRWTGRLVVRELKCYGLNLNLSKQLVICYIKNYECPVVFLR